MAIKFNELYGKKQGDAKRSIEKKSRSSNVKRNIKFSRAYDRSRFQKEKWVATNLTGSNNFFYLGQVEEFELSRKDGGQREVTRVVVARYF